MRVHPLVKTLHQMTQPTIVTYKERKKRKKKVKIEYKISKPRFMKYFLIEQTYPYSLSILYYEGDLVLSVQFYRMLEDLLLLVIY